MQNDGQNIHPRSRERPVFQPYAAPSVPSPVPAGEMGLQHLPVNPYLLSGDEVVRQLRTNPDDGLSDQEAESRLTIFGLNELSDGPGVSVVEIFLRQIFNAMSLVTLPFTFLKNDSAVQELKYNPTIRSLFWPWPSRSL